MKNIHFILYTMVALLASTIANAQKEEYPVVGKGDRGYIPVFFNDYPEKPVIRNSTLEYIFLDKYTTLSVGSDFLAKEKILFDNQNNYIDLYNDGNSYTSLSIRNGSNGRYTENLTVSNKEGKTFIGIANPYPAYALDINGNIFADDAEFENIKIEQSTASSGKILQSIDNEGNAEWATLNSLGIFSPWNTFTYTETKGTGIYTTYGRVAINKTTASKELEVGGSIEATQNIYGQSGVFSNDMDIADDLTVGGHQTGTSATFSEDLKMRDLLMTNNDFSILSDNGTPALTVTPAEVTIGHDAYNSTTNLTVNGTIKAEEVLVVPDVWADYVFTDKYQLRSLHELEAFIHQNKHLPGIPNEQTVKSEGIELSEMNAKLLEKVEEMTLYIIQQQKAIEKLQNKVEQLEIVNQ